MDLQTIIIAILGGLVAGFINTLAGNGSAITLSILTEVIGLPPNLANGTNRVGVLFQGIASTTSFVKNDRIDFQKSRYLLILAIIGAIVGVVAAVNISNEGFKLVFRYLLILMLFVVLIKPQRWLIEDSSDTNLNPWISIPSFLLLGFYGGFIQMGMGVIFLVVTVIIMRFNLIDANALKTFIVTIYTILVVAIFQVYGLIDWKVGLVIAIGQAIGGYYTAEFASKYPRSEIWAYRILIVVIFLAILSTFGVFSYLFS